MDKVDRQINADGEGNMTDKAQAIEVRDLYKRFGPLEVLKGVSLSASQGDVIALIGCCAMRR